MTRIRVVIADDYEIVRRGLRQLLVPESDIHLVGEAASGDETLAVVAAAHPDVILMDLKVPGLNGIAGIRVLRTAAVEAATLVLTAYANNSFTEVSHADDAQVRGREETDIVIEAADAGVELLGIAKEHAAESIVILLTGQATVETAVAALRQDADNSLIKPASLQEVNTSVVSALKRRDGDMLLRQEAALEATNSDGDRYRVVGTLTVDRHRHQVTIDHRAIKLTPTEFAILRTLAEADGRALTFDEIISAVHGRAIGRDEARDLLRPHIRHLRLKLGNAGTYLRNVRGFGYYLAPE